MSQLTPEEYAAFGLLQNAVLRLYQEDSDLLELGRVERACVFRIGVYFCELIQHSTFAALDVDSEYNRHGNGAKGLLRNADSEEKRKVLPDLLLHKRRCDDDNILVIEFKKENADHSDDIEKLKLFTAPDGEYKYRFGVFVDLKQAEPAYRLFKNSQEILS